VTYVFLEKSISLGESFGLKVLSLFVMTWLFYLFSSFAIASGIMVIQSRNPVHSVLFLILVFFNGAGLLILLGLDFFAMVFLVVYVGAIAVLFLFVVMMLNIKLAEISEKKLRYLPIGGFLGLLFLGEMVLIVNNDLIPWIGSSDMWTTIPQTTAGPWISWARLVEAVTPLESVGVLLYTYYFYFFILASLILLVAMLGAIVLTLHKGVHIRRQDVFEQNTREFAKTVIKVS
jgi:NADH:ubiquinone oxidoreductase subunit 6 (subunit J)